LRCREFREAYTEEEIKNLEKLHTKQLLNKKRGLYIAGDICIDSCGDLDECNECLNNEKFNLGILKNILSTREHILNKKESKELRKAKIKKGI
jgi:hypothetical protein